jgi:hypothetical protein
MSDAAELAFINTFARTLSGLPVVYPDDYRQPPENSLKRVPILPVRASTCQTDLFSLNIVLDRTSAGS